MAEETVSKTSVFEQYWLQLRHIESERMWIMGIWLGITGFMLKEIWGPHLTVQSVRSMSLAHLILTFAVLVIASKLNLECTRYTENIRNRAAYHTGKKELKGLWAIIMGEKTAKWFNPILTLGGISSAILIAGIVLDGTLMIRPRIGDGFIWGLPHCAIFFPCWGVAVWVYQQWFFVPFNEKLKCKLKPGTEEDHPL